MAELNDFLSETVEEIDEDFDLEQSVKQWSKTFVATIETGRRNGDLRITTSKYVKSPSQIMMYEAMASDVGNKLGKKPHEIYNMAFVLGLELMREYVTERGLLSESAKDEK